MYAVRLAVRLRLLAIVTSPTPPSATAPCAGIATAAPITAAANGIRNQHHGRKLDWLLPVRLRLPAV